MYHGVEVSFNTAVIIITVLLFPPKRKFLFAGFPALCDAYSLASKQTVAARWSVTLSTGVINQRSYVLSIRCSNSSSIKTKQVEEIDKKSSSRALDVLLQNDF